MIAVIHAYSRVNVGDGLLVDLTLERLGRVGITVVDCTVVALDAASFADLPHVVAVGTPGRAIDRDLVVAAGKAVGVAGAAVSPRLAAGAAASALAAADGFVAVGGGYLRTGTRTNAVGTLVNHLPQLLAASRSDRPSIYLPQSIGPLDGPVGKVVGRGLRGVTSVHARDDRSVAALDGRANVTRTPDLAVLDVAERVDTSAVADASGIPVLVGRALGDAPDYPDRLRDLARRLGTVSWGVQAEGSAAKSDRTFYDGLGITPDGRLLELLDEGATGPVVSVRLHGALQSVLAGVPAVHLGYERKSWGAYEDLGIAEYVHDARRFDPIAVAAQVEALRADPTPFWSAIAALATRHRRRVGAAHRGPSPDRLSRAVRVGPTCSGRDQSPTACGIEDSPSAATERDATRTAGATAGCTSS